MNASRISFFCIVALALLAGCDDGLKKQEVGTLSWTPQRFEYPKIQIGSSADDTVVLENIGAGMVKLANWRITGASAGDFDLYWFRGTDPSVEQSFGIVDGQDFFNTIDLESGGIITLVLNYHPSADETAPGAIEFETNDAENRTVRIPIETLASGAEIRCTPSDVDFERVQAGSAKTKSVTCQNTGSAVAIISDVQLQPADGDFHLSINGVDPAEDPSVLNDLDGDGQAGLAPNGRFTFDVEYAPQVDGPDSGEVRIFSNARVEQVVVSLKANGASPCINVNPESLDFGPALVGRPNPRAVTIESCGGEPLTILDIKIQDETGTFALDENTVPALPANLPGYDPNDPQQPAPPSRSITVNFSPTDEVAYGAKLLIKGNDPQYRAADNEDFDYIEVPLLGRGTINECPTAAVAQAEFDVLPLDIVTLDGGASTDADGPEGRPVSYTWTVVSRPPGSTAQPVERFFNPASPADGGPADRTDTPTAFFFVDLVGEYRLELTVTDNLDATAPSELCQQPAAEVIIRAEPDEDIHVQLVWNTPGDPDQTDGEGSDVDLHLLHPQGRAWSVAPLDCYFANSEPDWGPLGPAGNPSLDIDDVNGAGPENINLDEPEDTNALGGFYRVGVHYFRAENFVGGGTWGPSEVTLRIFLGGEQAGEWTRELRATDHFWEVASIIWSANEGRAQEINRYHNRVP